MNGKKSLIVTCIKIGVPLVTIGSLLVFAYLGLYSRYISDDFFSATVLRTYGYWDTQVFYWKFWTGRYSFIALISFVELFGPRVVTILPALFLFLLTFSVGWATYQLISQNGFDNPVLLSLSLASVIPWVSIRSLSQYSQLVFWQTGILNYTISPILLALGIGMLIKRFRSDADAKLPTLLAFTGFAFIIGGFSEIAVAVHIALLGGTILLVAWKKDSRKKNKLLLLGPLMLGSILSLVVMSLAPGNYVRATTSVGAYAWMKELSLSTDLASGRIGSLLTFPQLLAGLYDSLIQALLFIPKWFNERTTFALWSFLVGVFLKLFYPKNKTNEDIKDLFRSLLENGFIVFLGVWAAFAISYVPRGVPPPERALFLPYFLATCLVIYSGWIVASMLYPRLPRSAFAIAQAAITIMVYTGLVLGPVFTSIGGIRLLPAIKTYANLWDERDQKIRESAARGEKTITVTDFQKHPGLQDMGELTIWKEGELEEDPNYWTNQAAAWYYGVDAISAK